MKNHNTKLSVHFFHSINDIHPHDSDVLMQKEKIKKKNVNIHIASII